MAFASGLSEPLGAAIAFLFLRPILTELMLGWLFSLIAGLMLYISFDELIPSSRQYGAYAALALRDTGGGGGDVHIHLYHVKTIYMS